MKSRGNEWGHVIPKADSKFWTGDHSIRKSYIKGIQCSFHFWTYNILPPILSSLHISFMCSQSISTSIKKVSTFNNAQSILLDSYVLLDLYSRWFPIWLLTRLIVLLSHRWVSHLRLCTVTKEEGKMRHIIFFAYVACMLLPTTSVLVYRSLL